MAFQTPVKFPNTLKKDLRNWSAKENIWLNISHFPWPLDKDCRKYVVVFIRYSKRFNSRYTVTFAKPSTIPVVGLASYPSSGNTWLRCLTIFLCLFLVCLEDSIYCTLNSRYLLEGVTGHYTGSMYNDISLRKKGFYGRPLCY